MKQFLPLRCLLFLSLELSPAVSLNKIFTMGGLIPSKFTTSGLVCVCITSQCLFK